MFTSLLIAAALGQYYSTSGDVSPAISQSLRSYPQSCPGGVCPSPTIYRGYTMPTPTPAPQPAWGWYYVTLNGQTQVVWGYPDGGLIRYNAASNPQIKPAPTPPPTPPAPTKPAQTHGSLMPGVLICDDGKSLNAGVDLKELKEEATQLWTNDRAFGEKYLPKQEGLPLVGDAAADSGNRRKPEPRPEPEPPVDHSGALILAGGLVVIAAAVIWAGKHREAV